MTLSDNIRGAGLMVAAMTAFTLNDTLIKLLAGAVPLFQVISVRGALTVLLVGILATRMGALTMRLPRRDWGILGLRGVSEAAAAYFFLTALFEMPIANLTAILQALPLTVTLASALFLGETVGWRRFLAIGIGLAGVMLIVRPGTDGFTIFAAYGVLTVVCATVRDLCSRRLSPAVPSMTATFVTAVAVTLLGLLMSLSGEAWVALDTRSWIILIAAALLVLLAYQTIVMAMRVGEVGFVAPFRYTGLVVAMIAGLAVFGEWPDGLTLIGSGIVVASGLYTIWREQRLRKEGHSG